MPEELFVLSGGLPKRNANVKLVGRNRGAVPDRSHHRGALDANLNLAVQIQAEGQRNT
jgi:hypothetical protein